MFSLLQQTAPVAVETTPTTAPAAAVTVTPAAPATTDATSAQTGTVTVTPSAADVTTTQAAGSTAAQTNATDAIVVPDASAAGAPHVAETGMGHAPVAGVTDAAHAAAAGGHDAAASAGMPQLDFATFGNQVFWLIVALVLIYLILSRVAIPRIGRILGDRQGLMTADLAAAEDFKRKARDAEAAYEKALADARSEAGKIVTANKAEIDAELKSAIEKADAEISARTAESERRIGEIRQSAAADAQTVAADVAAELVRAFGANPDQAAVSAAVDARIKGAVQ